MTQDMTLNDMREDNWFVRALDRLDRLPDGPFFAVWWLVRWPIVLILSPLQYGLAILFYGTSEPEFLKDAMNITVAQQFIGGVIVAPILVVAVECALMYFIFCRRPRKARPWLFIVLSAFIMVIQCPLAAFPCAAATGFFLAYCFAHYAQTNMLKAYGFTVLYLACINMTGVVMNALGFFP
ncbi:MAG: hypothetical protein IT365_19390 [Candidatus Hydrogenedentes bacterium]|nr:hypothetical protein [Candidatus Hydrogenedentota bacterium]